MLTVYTCQYKLLKSAASFNCEKIMVINKTESNRSTECSCQNISLTNRCLLVPHHLEDSHRHSGMLTRPDPTHNTTRRQFKFKNDNDYIISIARNLLQLFSANANLIANALCLIWGYECVCHNEKCIIFLQVKCNFII